MGAKHRRLFDRFSYKHYKYFHSPVVYNLPENPRINTGYSLIFLTRKKQTPHANNASGSALYYAQNEIK